MKIPLLCRGALLCFWLSLVFEVSFCNVDHRTVEVIGVAECADCMQKSMKSSYAVSGLRVSIDCKSSNGLFKKRGVGMLDEGGSFKVALPNEIVEDGKLKEDCFAQLHSASASPCPATNGLHSSKIIFKSKTGEKHIFEPAEKLKFSPVTCTSAFLWPYFKHPHAKVFPKPLHPPLPFFKKPLHPFLKKPLPPPIPIVKKHFPPLIPKQPLAPPVPVYEKPLPPPIPVYKKPLPPPTPILKKPPSPTYVPKKPLPPSVPIYKKPLPPPFPEKPLPPPVPIFKKPLPPSIPKKPCLPTIPIFKKPLPPHIPFYKPKPPFFKHPFPKVFPPKAPLFKKPFPPPIPFFKPLPPFP